MRSDYWYLDADNEENQAGGKKKVITIPLRFNDAGVPRDNAGGLRRGSRRGSGRPRDWSNRNDQPNGKLLDNIRMHQVDTISVL